MRTFRRDTASLATEGQLKEQNGFLVSKSLTLTHSLPLQREREWLYDNFPVPPKKRADVFSSGEIESAKVI